jgi:23S rRNA (uracil1939-C5)-methyltransferase
MTIWPDILELSVDGIAQGGEGVGRWDGRVVFVGGALPGERVRVQIRERRGSYARGEAVEILEASPDRREPKVENADWMSWQYISHEAQLRFKRQILADQLAKIAGLPEVEVAPTLAVSSPWNYRNSVHLHCNGQAIGYYAAGSRELITIHEDPLLQPVLNEAIAALQQVKPDVLPSCEITIRTSESTGSVLAAFRIRGDRSSDAYVPLRSLANKWRAAFPKLEGISFQSVPPYQIGVPFVTEELGNVGLQVSATSFFQVNRSAAEALLNQVMQKLPMKRTDYLLDLYCGVGSFTLPLASRVAQVVGVEEYAPAIADAKATAHHAGIDNVHFEIGPVERVLKQFEDPFDVALLDPARRGCHPMALEELLRIGPEHIAYVSCHPGTLARDLKVLVEGGYTVTSVQPVDLFPQTPHIESVTILKYNA